MAVLKTDCKHMEDSYSLRNSQGKFWCILNHVFVISGVAGWKISYENKSPINIAVFEGENHFCPLQFLMYKAQKAK